MPWSRVLFVGLLAGCAHSAEPPKTAHAAPATASVAAGVPGSEAEPPRENLPLERAVAEADGIYRDQLAVPARDERFSTDRQVAALTRAIALYEQFLERAGDDP